MTTMNFYLLAALSSGFFFAINGLIYKISSKYAIRDPLRLLFYIFLLQLPSSLSVAFFTRIFFPVELLPSFLGFVSTFFLGSVLVGLAVPHLDASVLLPLFNLQVILTAFFSFLMLGETYGWPSYLLMLAIVLGGVLVSLDEKFSLRFNRPLYSLLVGLILYSLSDAFGGRVVASLGVLNLRFWSGLVLVLFSFLLIPFFRVPERVRIRQLVPVFLVGFFGFFGMITLTFGFVYSVSISQALARLSSVYSLLLIILLARFRGDFLEKHPWRVYLVRCVGCGVMVLASAILLFLNG